MLIALYTRDIMHVQLVSADVGAGFAVLYWWQRLYCMCCLLLPLQYNCCLVDTDSVLYWLRCPHYFGILSPRLAL